VSAGNPEPMVGVVGNVTRDADLRYSKSGNAVASFAVAVRPWVPGGGEQPPVTFHEVVTFGSLAENVAERVKKGQRVCVVGRYQDRQWTDRAGDPRVTTELAAEGVGPDLRFASSANGRPYTRAQGPEPYYKPTPRIAPSPNAGADF